MNSNTPAPLITVAEVVASLLKMDQTLPVLVSTGYDNDTEHSSSFGIAVSYAEPQYDGDIWTLLSDSDAADPDFKNDYPDAIKAVTITA